MKTLTNPEVKVNLKIFEANMERLCEGVVTHHP